MRKKTARALLSLAAVAAVFLAGVRGTQDAVANGETRTLSIVHAHTGESATITFRRNGRYDSDALNQLNWILRDWRLDKATRMEPRLFDIVWEVYREVGAREPIHVLSAYRAPETNSMLRRRSRGVSEHSQHMVGKAMDFKLPDVDMGRVRAIAMRLQHGGVGYYPSSGFVHLDAGSVRAWPRMTHDQLARLFPDGKTVHLPSNGRPFARYEEARAEILSRGGFVGGAPADDGSTGTRRSLWATLFGGGDEDADYYGASQSRGLFGVRNATAYAPSSRDDESSVMAGLRPSAPRAVGGTQVAAAGSNEGSGFRFPWQRKPAEPAQAAQVDEPSQTGALAPIPPRRPDELIAALAVPMPPARPLDLTGLTPTARQMGPAQDDRAALKALFTAAAAPTAPPVPVRAAPVATSRATPQPVPANAVVADLGPALNLGFSSAPTGDLVATAFTGPAVKPLPVLR